MLTALGACAPADPHTLAAADDARHATGTFTWLVDHEPSAVVTWHVSAARVRALLPASRVRDAMGRDPCGQARGAHALLVLIEAGNGSDRDRAEDCGFALSRDAGGIVVAPR